MYPSVRDGDFCIFYTLEAPYPDSIILYRYNGNLRVGRVVAVPGQTIEVTDDGYLVNGYQSAEEIPFQTQKNGDVIKYPLVLSDDEYFILNDYRMENEDSRTFGAIKKKDIVGKMMFILRRRGF